MIKIIITKTEDIKAVIKKIQDSEDVQITLVVPRESFFGEQVKNFELLKEAATELDKEIIVESVDENVLALAEANGFASLHPLFRGGRPGHVSDIVSPKPAKASRAKKGKAPEKSITPAPGRKEKKPVLLDEIEGELKEVEEEVRIIEDEVRGIEGRGNVLSRTTEAPRESVRVEAQESGSPKKGGGKKIFAATILLLVLAAIYFGGERFFARAEITIQMKNTPWQDSSVLTASKTATDVSSVAIPASVLTYAVPHVDLPFPASGKSQVSEKATGKITVYNAYSSQDQTLVATTRFQSPDGKIVRLVNQIIVPGAKIQDGKIIPSSLVADVVADKPGADYNIGPLPKLTIPGFKGTPKFDGFYGTLDMQLSGGFIGVRSVPTASDISLAKSKATATLLAEKSLVKIDSDLKVLDGATNLNVTKLVVDSAAGEDGNFFVHGDAALTVIGFRESDVKSWLLLKAQKADPTASFRSLNPVYSNAQPDFTHGTLKFTVTSDGVVTPAFDSAAFKNLVAGKSSADAKALILEIPELADGKLSVWPIWLQSLPTDPSKIKVTVE